MITSKQTFKLSDVDVIVEHLVPKTNTCKYSVKLIFGDNKILLTEDQLKSILRVIRKNKKERGL